MNRAIEKLLEKCFVMSRIKIISFSANPTKWSNILKQFVDELFEYVWPFCGVVV